jgi:hypothetical protein
MEKVSQVKEAAKYRFGRMNRQVNVNFSVSGRGPFIKDNLFHKLTI